MAWCRIGDKPLSELMLTWLTDAYMRRYRDEVINKTPSCAAYFSNTHSEYTLLWQWCNTRGLKNPWGASTARHQPVYYINISINQPHCWRHDRQLMIHSCGLGIDITVMSHGYHGSPATPLFVQPFVYIKENFKALLQWPLWGESIGDWWFPLTRASHCEYLTHLLLDKMAVTSQTIFSDSFSIFHERKVLYFD